MTTIVLGPKIDVGIISQSIKIIDYKEGLERIRKLIDFVQAKIILGNSTLIGKTSDFSKFWALLLRRNLN